MAPPERTDGAEYGVNSKEPELSLVCPFRFFFIHPIVSQIVFAWSEKWF